MKQLLKTLILLLILFSVVFNAGAQSHNKYNIFKISKEQSPVKSNLPANRAAFIFSAVNGNSTYSNPAYAMLNNKTSNEYAINSKNTTISSLIANENKLINEQDICMFSNQTDDELWVQLDKKTVINQELNLEIYNALGERVYQSRIEQNLYKINVCDFIAGTFLVKLGDSVQKMIIE